MCVPQTRVSISQQSETWYLDNNFDEKNNSKII